MNNKFWKQCDNNRLEYLLSVTKDVAKLKHIQAVYLKSYHCMKADDIAKIVGFSKGYILLKLEELLLQSSSFWANRLW